MEPVATRDFTVRVTPGIRLVDDHVAGLVAGIYVIRLNWTTCQFIFIPYEPNIWPQLEWDTSARTEVDDWRTTADARRGLFYGADIVVTPRDQYAGQEFWFPSQETGLDHGEGCDGKGWKPKDGVVFFISIAQYEIFTADLEQFLKTHSDEDSEERALDLPGRPVIDFLVERLQTSRLVPGELLDQLGLERTVPAVVKSVARRDFPTEVTRKYHFDDYARGLISDILEIELDGRYEFIFVPFESQMAPPFPADTAAWAEFDDWETPTDARLGLFYYDASFVITRTIRSLAKSSGSRHTKQGVATSADTSRGGYLRTAWCSTPLPSSTRSSPPTLQFLETHSDRNQKALDLQGRPVIDFLVDRLQTSRLVPDELLQWLGLERTPTT